MGLLFNLDTDTVKGPSESLYCRIDQITIQKDANRIIVSLIYFKDIEKSSRIDCISYEVLVYENEDNLLTYEDDSNHATGLHGDRASRPVCGKCSAIDR